MAKPGKKPERKKFASWEDFLKSEEAGKRRAERTREIRKKLPQPTTPRGWALDFRKRFVSTADTVIRRGSKTYGAAGKAFDNWLAENEGKRFKGPKQREAEMRNGMSLYAMHLGWHERRFKLLTEEFKGLEIKGLRKELTQRISRIHGAAERKEIPGFRHKIEALVELDFYYFLHGSIDKCKFGSTEEFFKEYLDEFFKMRAPH